MANDSSTRERLLDAAEQVMAERGFNAASLRQITSRAGANLAAVNYHFGSKLELVQAVFARRLGPMNAERLEQLEAVMAEAGDGRPDLRGILRAFLGPALGMGRSEGREFFVMVARAHSAPNVELNEAFVSQFGEVIERFREALQRALPGAPLSDVFWSLHFIIGALCHTVVSTHLLTLATNGLCTDEDGDAVLESLVDFAVAGMRRGETA